MRKILSTYRYEFIAALSGAVVMMLELIGGRMVAPYFGMSIYVWTAMIGVILGALSVGYWYGGKLADTNASDKGLAGILGLAAAVVGVSILAQEPLLHRVAQMPVDVRIQAVLAALLLFAPASCLLGVVSPYVVKLKLSSLATAGSSVGRLYAAGTAGSIIGTFATGYWLIAWFGNYTLGLGLVLLLIGVSFVAHPTVWRWQRIVVGTIALGALIIPVASPVGIIADVDSAYSRYRISETTSSGRTVRLLLTDSRSAQSGYVVGHPDELVFQYIQGFKNVADAYGPMRDMLVIGGGGYTFPGFIARRQPQTGVDVVEIDPMLDQVAAKYFDFHQSPNLQIIHQDGRVFLNKNSRTYDLAYIDAFSSLSPPYQLATVEASQALKRAVKPDGLAVANVVARAQADDPYFAATYQTYRHVFESVKVYRMQPQAGVQFRQNLLFVMGAQATVQRVAAGLRQYQEVNYPASGQMLRDDHAPVDQLINANEL